MIEVLPIISDEYRSIMKWGSKLTDREIEFLEKRFRTFSYNSSPPFLPEVLFTDDGYYYAILDRYFANWTLKCDKITEVITMLVCLRSSYFEFVYSPDENMVMTFIKIVGGFRQLTSSDFTHIKGPIGEFMRASPRMKKDMVRNGINLSPSFVDYVFSNYHK